VKKAKSDEMRPEYRRGDLGKGDRGKYFASYRKGTDLVLISPDISKVFPTDQAVNSALCSLIEVAEKSVRPTKRSSQRAKTHG